MLITFVVPAYNASETIGRTLASIYRYPSLEGWEYEVIVVDDGSDDSAALLDAIGEYENLRVIRHEKNQGMCASRNSGIAESRGDVVIILDSDDELVEGWPEVYLDTIEGWPRGANLCYAACRNSSGEITASEPDYEGYLTLDDILNERHSGEYLPMFRGEYVRKKGYVDLGMRKSCGIVSYIGFALDAPIWISKHVLRIYNDDRPHSVTHGWTSAAKARETVRCYEVLLERYGSLYKENAPETYCTKQLRLAVYRRLACESGAWRAWCDGLSFKVIPEVIGAAMILLVGPGLGASIASSLKKMGLIRRYG